MPWKPGQSGNPSGRPKINPELRDLARRHTKIALTALVEIARDAKAPPAARVAAANALLDRGYGRPMQAVDLEVQQHAVIWPEPLTTEQWVEKFGRKEIEADTPAAGHDD
jgi:uncharacterized protein DUF5681